MKILRTALAVLVACALLVAAAVTALVTLDLGALGRPLTAWVGRQIERTIAVDGELSIKAGQTLRLSAEGVRLANVSWGSRGDMLSVTRMIVEIDTWSLIRRPVVLRRVEIDGLDLLLERNADGANNWEFGSATDDEGFTWPESLPVVLERASLPGARVAFIGPRLERQLTLYFDQLEQSGGKGGILELTGYGHANDTALDIKVVAGPVASLIVGRDFTASLDMQLGEIDLDAKLRVDDIANPADTALTAKLRGPDAHFVAARFGVRNLGSGPIALDGIVRPASSGEGIQGELSGSIGQFTVKAKARLAEPSEMRRLGVQLELAGPDLSFAAGLAGVDRLPAEPFRLTAAVDRANDMLRIDEATLALADSRADLSGTIADFREMTGIGLRFRFRGSEVGRFRRALSLPEAMSGPFDIAGEVRGDNDAEHIELTAETGLARLVASGTLGSYPDYYGSRVRIDASGPSLVAIAELAGLTGLPSADFAIGGDIEWTERGSVIRSGTLRAGRDQFGLDGRIARKPLDAGTAFTWTARGPDLRSIAVPLGLAGAPDGAFDLSGRLRREPGVTRLDSLKGTVAGATVRFSGRIADEPRRGTDLEFSVAGPRLEHFAVLLPDYPLPQGKFSVAGGMALTEKRVTARKVRVAVAGAEGTADADIELPLSTVRGRFAVAANGDDLARFLPQPGTAQRGVGAFELRLRGTADGGSWHFDDARLAASVGSITASGKLDGAPDFSATALKFDVRVPDLSAVGRLFATKLPALPFQLTAAATGTPTAFRVERASGRLGKSDFDGRMQLDLRERTVLDLDFRSELLDLTPYLKAPAPASASAPVSPQKDRRLIPDSTIPLAWLDRADGSLAMSATRALIADVALNDMELTARLLGGSFTLDSLKLKAPPDGGLTLSGAVTRGEHGAAVRLSASGDRISLGRLGDTPAQRAARPRAKIQLDVAGEGVTWRELAQSLDGRMRLTTGPGNVPATSASLLFGNLLREIAAKVFPGAAPSDTVNMRCLAAFMSVADGVVGTAPAFVVQTETINLASQGSVDLHTEQIALYLRTAPRRGRVNLSMGELVTPYLMVNGTLARPGVTVDPKGALFSGGAAFATAGISILAKGVWDRVFQADDPCAAAAVEADRLDKAAAQPQKKSLLQKLRGR